MERGYIGPSSSQMGCYRVKTPRCNGSVGLAQLIRMYQPEGEALCQYHILQQKWPVLTSTWSANSLVSLYSEGCNTHPDGR